MSLLDTFADNNNTCFELGHTQHCHNRPEGAQRMLKYRSKMAILTYGSASIILFLVGYFVRGLSMAPPPPQTVDTPIALQAPAATVLSPPSISETQQKYNPDKDVWDAESSFETTMRSCLGSFCFDDAVKTAEQKDIVRVGLLMPDNIGAQTLQDMLLAGGLPLGANLELIYASNVPPYGYGKNHGWSRIIRIANHVIPHSVRLLAVNPSTSDIASIEKLITSQVQTETLQVPYVFNPYLMLSIL